MSHVNRTPEAKRPGYLHPWAAVARAEEAAEDETRARAAAEQAEQDAFERKVLALREANGRVRIMLADVKFELALRALGRKYSQNQPRVPAGSREGGQWTRGGGESAADGSDQPSRNAAGSGQRIRFAQLTSPAGTVNRRQRSAIQSGQARLA